MVQPVINIEENIGETVGGRRIKDSLEYGLGLQKSRSSAREEPSLPRFPKGVFKFRSFEEADAWVLCHMTAPKRQPRP